MGLGLSDESGVFLLMGTPVSLELLCLRLLDWLSDVKVLFVALLILLFDGVKSRHSCVSQIFVSTLRRLSLLGMIQL